MCCRQRKLYFWDFINNLFWAVFYHMLLELSHELFRTCEIIFIAHTIFGCIWLTLDKIISFFLLLQCPNSINNKKWIRKLDETIRIYLIKLLIQTLIFNVHLNYNRIDRQKDIENESIFFKAITAYFINRWTVRLWETFTIMRVVWIKWVRNTTTNGWVSERRVW